MTFRFDVVTIFPELLQGYLSGGMIGRAIDRRLIDVRFTNPRDFTADRHRTVDDAPFGGGAGMVMKPEPLCRAVEHIKADHSPELTILLSPSGRVFRQDIAAAYAALGSLVLVCGRYEGVDERVAAFVVDDELSIGDYVLTGGELGSLVVIDAVSRLLPGVLGNEVGPNQESFTDAPLLEYPQYTRPRVWRGHAVPEVLLSGDHGAIARWREQERETRTRRRRPDLLGPSAEKP